MKKIKYLITVFTLSGLLFSCASNKEIANNLSAAQIIQLGQNAIDSSNYPHAEKCFLEVIKRYGTNLTNYIEARYEIGHLYIKTKNYDKAFSAFTEIIDMYASVAATELPPEYKKLAQIGLSQIPAKKLEALSRVNPGEEE